MNGKIKMFHQVFYTKIHCQGKKDRKIHLFDVFEDFDFFEVKDFIDLFD